MRNIFLFALLIFTACSKGGGDDTPPGPPPGTPIPQVDDAISAFMSKYNVPGMAVAITRNGKLVYVKGYGKADKASGNEVKDNSLFRIASVSKPITAVAIMKLVEANKLKLDDKAFGTGSILGTTYGTMPYKPHVTDITVRHLLEHTAGGWSNTGSDPMFTNPAMSKAELISWTLNNRALNTLPGFQYAYSNFGYCVLGRVIEKASGQTYEQYVKEKILQPAGITEMMIGGNTAADKKINEVSYYGQNGEDPYIYNVARMDAHGGWLASATDLLRFLVKVDGFSTKPDILNGNSITTMTTASSSNPNYALGWNVNAAKNWWHMGSLPGTTTEIVRTQSGWCWALLTNTRSNAGSFLADLDGLIWQAINNNATQWLATDLF